MLFSCPGSQHFKAPYPENMNCPFCGADVEIWSDEGQATCEGCGKAVSRRSGQCCLDWCKFAKECVGEEKYKKYKAGKKEDK